jgi:hypothetical protein
MEMAKPEETQSDPVASAEASRASAGLEDLGALFQRLQSLKDLLSDTECVGGRTIARIAQRLHREIETFSATLTVVGPARTGKTSLVNLLAGRPGFLPTDAAPWTGAIATLHLNSVEAGTRPAARFRLLTPAEQDRRADGIARDLEIQTEDEARRAFCDMLQTVAGISRRRLGEGYENALGMFHEFTECDPETLRRFISTKAEFEAACGRSDQDYLADLSAEADLDLDAPHLPLALNIRDVPGGLTDLKDGHDAAFRGVNGEDVCVLVLSALDDPQTLGGAVHRQLAGLTPSQVVIFVNRIDAVVDPEQAIEAFHTEIMKVLDARGLAKEAAIVFGSARWAEAALDGKADVLTDATRRALIAMGQTSEADPAWSPEDQLWDLSGIPALWRALSSRITAGPGSRLTRSVRGRALSGIMAANATCQARGQGADHEWGITGETLDAAFDRIEKAVVSHLEVGIEKLIERYTRRVEQAERRFVMRATMALEGHLKGDETASEPWRFGTDGLRSLLDTAHDGMRDNLCAMWRAHAEDADERISKVYQRVVAGLDAPFKVAQPDLPSLPRPMALGRPVELDVRSTWWVTLGAEGVDPRQLRGLVAEAIAPVIRDVKQRLPAEISAQAVAAMRMHISEQREILDSLIESRSLDEDDLDTDWNAPCTAEETQMIALVMDELSDNA